MKIQLKILKCQESILKLQKSNNINNITIKKLNKKLMERNNLIKNSNVNSNNTINNINNNIINNINLIGFGKDEEELLKTLTMNEKKQIMYANYRCLDKLVEIVHCGKYDQFKNIIISNIKDNYLKKLYNRFNKNDYPFEDAEIVFQDIIFQLKDKFSAEIVPMIHGDLWFSNILYTYTDEFRFIDMKGKVGDIYTLNGDKYYDYGKLFQSIIGYDLILYNDRINMNYINIMRDLFLQKCINNGLDINYLKVVTKSLIFGTFHFIDVNDEIKNNIWNLIKSI